jgi:ribosomal protein S18 acetylase RimI-like enzyme
MSEATPLIQELDGQNILVEPARSDDAEAVFNVQRITWFDTYPNEKAGVTREDIHMRLEGKHGELIPNKIEHWRKIIETAGDERAAYVVRDGSKIVGFVAPTIKNGKRRVGALYVLPEFQGRGIGSKLLEKSIEWHGRNNDIFLQVASYNQNAIDFYRSHGFVETGNAVADEVAHRVGGKAIPETEMVLKADLN